MLIAADYPFMDVLWTIVIFFAWVCWILVLFRVFADLFRRDDVSGWGKALWTIFVIILPFLGTIVYLIAHGGDMGRRDAEQSRAAQTQFDDYVRSVASEQGPAAEIDRAKRLLNDGTITQAEFDAIKAKAVS